MPGKAPTNRALEVQVDCLGAGRHRFDVMVDNSEIAMAHPVPVVVIVGNSSGPLFGLVGGVHGDEYDGMLALQEIACSIDPAGIRGALLIIPVANPFAFAHGQRVTPQDGKDLNRVFPGDARGSLTQRLADLVCRRLLGQADAVFSLHGAGSDGVLSPWIELLDVRGSVGDASFAMAGASGFGDLIALEERPGRLLRAMGDLGVPMVEGEVGGLGATSHANVGFYRESVMSLGHHVGVFADGGAGTDQRRAPHVWRLGSVVQAEAGGIFLREVSLREEVRRGQRLGRIVDAHGRVLVEALAPGSGVVGGYRERSGVRLGQTLVTLWTPAEGVRARLLPDG